MSDAKILSLPFATAPADASNEIVGDDVIGKVAIKKIGCLTVNEKLGWDKVLLKMQSQIDVGEVTESDIIIAIVTMMLQHRFDPEWNTESTLAIPNHNLLEAIMEFFRGERNRWEPEGRLLQLQGAGAKDLAVSFAKENSAVVMTRNDLKRQDMYFVFGSRGLIPISEKADILQWEVIAAFDEEPEDFSQPVDKKKKLTGVK